MPKVKFDVSVSGLKQLEQNLDSLSEDLRYGALKDFTKQGAKDIKQDAKQNAPVGEYSAGSSNEEGNLKSAISYKQVPKSRTNLDIEYLVYVRDHPERVRWDNPGAYGRWVEFGHAIVDNDGTIVGYAPAIPFMRNAYLSNDEKIIANAKDEVEQRIKDHALTYRGRRTPFPHQYRRVRRRLFK